MLEARNNVLENVLNAALQSVLRAVGALSRIHNKHVPRAPGEPGGSLPTLPTPLQGTGRWEERVQVEKEKGTDQVPKAILWIEGREELCPRWKTEQT